MHAAVPSKALWKSQCRGLAALLLVVTLLVVYSSSGKDHGDTHIWPNSPHSRHGRRVLARSSADLSLNAKRPPQAPRAYNDTPDILKQMLADHGEKEKSIVQDIIDKVRPEEATFENAILPYIQHENEASPRLGLLNFYSYLSPIKELQAASRELLSNLSDITQATYLNEDYFARVNTTYYKQANDTALDAESQKLLYTFWDNFRGTGLAVPQGEKRDRYQDIAKELIVVTSDYKQANIDDNTTLWFTREDLNGTKEDTLDALENGSGDNQGMLKLSLRSESDISAILAYCTNETSRQTILTARLNTVPENVARLKKAVVLRDERARLLGAPNFATTRIEQNMAKSPDAVHKQLDNVQQRVKSAAARRITHLEQLKKADTGKADPLYLWDYAHYVKLSMEREYNVTGDKMKEYFPAETTMHAILDMYAELYHLHFVKIEGKDRDDLAASGRGEELVYQPDVELYAVWNEEAWSLHSEESGGNFVGYLYLDVFQREGKAGGAYTASIEPGFVKKDGSRHYPTCVMATNFKKSQSDTPSLLHAGEIQTIFHELGHAMHHLTSRVTYQRFHGPSGCPPDFFEAPSQMMENWIYEPQVLQRLSKHWSYLSDDAKAAWEAQQQQQQQQQNASAAVQRPPEQMPDDMIAGFMKSRNSYSSNAEQRQVFLSVFDLKLHEPATHEDAERLDTTQLYNELYKNITGISGPEVLGKGYTWGHPESSSFVHTMIGYEAVYYAYLWSRVYCKDLFYTAFKKDPFSREQGGRFRKLVLEPGGSQDFYKMLTTFLGHEPSDQPYFDNLELDQQ